MGRKIYDTGYYIAVLISVTLALIIETVEGCDDPNNRLLVAHKATDEDKWAILKAHNFLRMALANGKIPSQPTAANMQKMQWDEELAIKALEWGSKCLVGHHDPDRHVERFRVGQNMAAFWTTKKPRKQTDVMPDYFEAIGPWFEEYKLYSFGKVRGPSPQTGHYTQMVWANTNKIGCAYALSFNSGKGYVRQYLCNYGPSGNVLRKTPYALGEPSCHRYQMSESQDYPGLCVKSSKAAYDDPISGRRSDPRFDPRSDPRYQYFQL